jgi:hypothetical protein
MTCLRAVSGFSGGVPSIGVELNISVIDILFVIVVNLLT